jgi:hypothetical protein
MRMVVPVLVTMPMTMSVPMVMAMPAAVFVIVHFLVFYVDPSFSRSPMHLLLLDG